MRKKSHISLAWYLMNNEGMESLKHHKGAFYIGSILPDCIPSFLGYEGYPGSVCISINDEVVHGLPKTGITF